MRKSIFIILFLFILSGLFGQIRSENRWILGTWLGESDGNRGTLNYEIVLNDNGTGRWVDNSGALRQTQDIVFSIYDNNLFVFSSNGRQLLFSFGINRINDQRIVLHEQSNWGIYINLTKRS